MDSIDIVVVLDTKSYFVCDGTLFIRYESENWFKPVDAEEGKRWILAQFPKELRTKLRGKASGFYKELLTFSDRRINLKELRKTQQFMLNCKNGVLRLEGGKVEAVKDDKLIFTSQLDFCYNPEVRIEDALTFSAFCASSLQGDPVRIRLLLQIIAACISNFLRFRKAYFFIGMTGSGKSIFAEFLTRVIGEELVSCIPMSELNGKHASSALAGKHLNVDDELTTRRIKDAANFKSLVSMSRIKCEPKGVNALTFTNRAHLLFCGNALPDFSDFDGSNQALFSRMVVLDFPITIEDADVDISLGDKLWEERDIICSLAVNELSRLLDMPKPTFLETDGFKRVKEVYTEGAQALDRFLAECCVFGEDFRCHSRDFLAAFRGYCNDNALEYKGSDTLIKKKVLEQAGVASGKFRMNTYSRRGFYGVGLKDYYMQDTRK